MKQQLGVAYMEVVLTNGQHMRVAGTQAYMWFERAGHISHYCEVSAAYLVERLEQLGLGRAQ